MDLGRVIDVRHPVRYARYALAGHGWPTLADALGQFVREHVTIAVPA
jgi:hypothetical protein